MDIREVFRVTRTTTTPSGLATTNKPLIEENIESLIDLLAEQDIYINLKDSEKHFSYTIRGEEVTSRLPLTEQVSTPINLRGYTLANEHLELRIKDYHTSSAVSTDLGAPALKEAGIECVATLNGSYEEARVLDTARHVIKRFYEQKQPSLLEIASKRL